MPRYRTLLFATLLVWPTFAAAQAAASAQPISADAQPSLMLAKGSRFYAVLTARADSESLKPGDTIAAAIPGKVTINNKDLTKGSKIVGHVTVAHAKKKGDPDSALGIIFDKIEIPGEPDVPLNGAIQAIGAPAVRTIGEMRAGRPHGATGMVADGGPPSYEVNALQVKLSDKGVTRGLRLTLSQNSIEGSVLTSSAKDLRLEEGTQFVIVTQ